MKTLSAVHSWTVLYEITTLTDEQFVELLKKAAERVNPKNMFEERAPFISFGMVLSVKREKHDKSPLCAYATVQIDFEALKAQLFSGDHLATLEEHLGQIEASLPYLRVVRSHVNEKAQGIYCQKLQVAMETAARKAYSALVTRVMERKPNRKKESKEKKMILAFRHKQRGDVEYV